MKTAKELDEAFDKGEDISDHWDLSSLRRGSAAIKRINVDIPLWMIEALDQEAARIGVTRQAVIKMWIARELDARSKANSEA
jgi:hypothetical protein